MSKRDLFAAAAGAMTATVLAGGVALAAIPGDGGLIQGCYDSGGNVKVVAALPCPKGYASLPWNQKGEQGPPGPKGDKGDPGPPGETGDKGEPGTAVAGLSCPEHEFLTGFESDGSLQCASIDGPGGGGEQCAGPTSSAESIGFFGTPVGQSVTGPFIDVTICEGTSVVGIQSDNPSFTLDAPTGQPPFRVTFSPTAVGTYTGFVHVRVSSGNDLAIPLFGTAREP
jgi:hypothetical protein